MKREMASQGPPGYEPDPAPKPKTKSAKRNERKKEKRLLVCFSTLYICKLHMLLAWSSVISKLSPLQATTEKGDSSEDGSAGNVDKEEAVSIETPSNGSQSMNVLASQMEALDVSSNNDVPGDAPNPGTTGEDVEKRIRALKKKVRFPSF